MASYPQQFSAGVYYVPPPETPGNAFAAAWHGWHQVRSPYAQALFNARLAALDPSAQYKLLENLYERRAQMLEQAASIERAQMQSASNAQAGSDRRYAAWVSATASMQAAYYQYRGARERGELDLQGELLKSGQLDTAAQGYLEEYQRTADAATQLANRGEAEAAAKVLGQGLDVARARIESMRGAGDPMQADALSRAVRGTQLPLRDNVLEQAMNASVEASIPASPTYETTKPSGVGRPAALPFWDPQAAPAASPSGSGQAPPSATGRQPVSTGGGTTAPAPSSTTPSSPAPATSPLGSTASSTSVRVSGPTSPITAQLLAAAGELSGDIADVRNRIPDVRGELGGFYDPIPGTPARGQRKVSPVTERITGGGPSMRAAAALAPRPTFAPLTRPAPSGTVAPQGEQAPQGPGGVASDAAPRSPPSSPRPAGTGREPSSPAGAPRPDSVTTGDPFGLLRPAVPLPQRPAVAPAPEQGALVPPPPGRVGGVSGGAGATGSWTTAEQLVGPSPALTRDRYVGGIMSRDLFGAGSGAAAQGGNPSPVAAPRVFDPMRIEAFADVAGQVPPRAPPQSSMDRVWTGDRWWDREQFVQEYMARNRADRAWAEVKWAEFAQGYMDKEKAAGAATAGVR